MNGNHEIRNPSRRTLFSTAAALSTAAAAVPVHAGVRPPSSVELLNVGAVALGDNSHFNYGIWSPMLNPVPGEPWFGRTFGMRISHCWDRDPEIAAAFAKKYGCEAVTSYGGMVDKVDAMVFGGFNEVKWWPQLTKPYLEAGIPCYINRPFAYSMKDARTIVETARAHNTPILSIDSQESFKESVTAHGKVQQLLRDGRTILGANSDVSAGYEYPQHGVHGLNYLTTIFGTGAVKVSLQTDNWWREKTASSPGRMQYGLITLQYDGLDIPGIGRQDNKFMIAQQLLTGYASNANVRIYYDGGWWDIDNHWTYNDRITRQYTMFFPMLLQMQKMFETRVMPQTYDYLLQKTKIFLAGFKSHLEHNGALIAVNDLPDDWEAPNPYPDWIDESMFG